jgi:hypothetical protein
MVEQIHMIGLKKNLKVTDPSKVFWLLLLPM